MLGFFLAGFLMSFLGAILPAWGYHLKSDFSTAGMPFLAMALGVLASAKLARNLIPNKGVSIVLTAGSGLACASLLYLALVSPPASSWWRFAGVLLLGTGTGLLIGAVFKAISPIYKHDPIATVNIAGVLFVLGSLTMTLLVSGTFYVYNVPSIMFLLALIPGFLTGVFAKSQFPIQPSRGEPSWKQTWLDIRTPAAVLFSLLLFFQIGNEWSLAGWLAIFLIQRLGVSPASSLLLLALYWLTLLMGRILAQFLLGRFCRGKLLMLSLAAALFGCIILRLTNSVFGAVSGILFAGGGFAAISPLVIEKVGFRFPFLRPGLLNALFTFAMMGGLLAPWTLGFFTDIWGIGFVMVLPLMGTLMVSLLLGLIWLEAKLSGSKEAASGYPAARGAPRTGASSVRS